MKEQDIIQGNELIAEFMGFVFYDDENMYYHIEEGYYLCEPNLVKYHLSWDWLMPVVEKIESLLFPNDNWINVSIGASKHCTIFDSNGEIIEFTGEEETKILSTWYAVVEFIKWYRAIEVQQDKFLIELEKSTFVDGVKKRLAIMYKEKKYKTLKNIIGSRVDFMKDYNLSFVEFEKLYDLIP